MIGKVTWVGHITCAECPEQMTDIPWGWARRELNKAGWKHNGKLWYCPGCKKGNPEL